MEGKTAASFNTPPSAKPLVHTMGSQKYIKPVFAFIIYAVAQALLGKNMVIGSYAFCFFYVAYLLSLPFEIGRPILMLIAFALGFSIDTLYDTMGLHISSCVLMAYLNEPIKQWIQPGGGYEPGMEPTVDSMGFQWVFSYSILLIFIHHTLFFFLEASNFALWRPTLFKIGASTAFTLAATLIIRSLGGRSGRAR